MAELGERKRFWNVFYSPLVFMILLVAFLFMARAVWRVYSHVRISGTERQRLEAELAIVAEREATLKNSVEFLETPQGVEDEIRSKFNVSKEGEGVAVIIDSTTTAGAAPAQNKPKSWWARLFGR